MKCPLQVIVGLNRGDSLNPAPVDCLHEECASWDEKHGCCGERTKRKQLERIADILSAIAKELTLIRPK